MLSDKALQHVIHAAHHLRVTVDLIRPELFNCADPYLFHVPRHDAREGATQVGSQHFHRLIRIEFEVRHVLMRRLEGYLKIRCDTDGPVKTVGIPGITTILFHQRHRFFHLTGHFCGIVNNNAVVTARIFAQRMHDKLVQHAEVVGALFRAGQDQRQNLIFVGRIHQDPQQIKQLFRRAYAAREDDDAVRDTDKRLKTFFDIRHNNQFVNQRVRRLSSDDRWLGHADKTAFFIALLCVSYCRAFHRRFHRARTATGTDIQFAQAELRPYAAGIQVFGFVN